MTTIADWTLDEIRTHYKMGQCHHMALAVAQRTGLPMAVMWNPLDWQIEPDEEGFGGVREIVHVYVDCGDDMIIDVDGLRSLDAMKRDMAGDIHDICPCTPLDDDLLWNLVHQSQNLVPFDQDDIDDALAVIDAVPALGEAVAAFAPPTPR